MGYALGVRREEFQSHYGAIATSPWSDL